MTVGRVPRFLQSQHTTASQLVSEGWRLARWIMKFAQCLSPMKETLSLHKTGTGMPSEVTG